jgi:hypothetical protein
MIARRELPTTGGPVVVGNSVRASHPIAQGAHSQPSGRSSQEQAADELARTTYDASHLPTPLPASEAGLSSVSPLFTPLCDDPATATLLAQLCREREPSLEVLESERFYSALGEMFERRFAIVIGEWNGYDL